MSIGYSKCLFLDRKHVFYPMSQEKMIIIISFLVQFRSTTKFSTALSYFFSAQIQTLKKWQHNRDDLFLANIFLVRVPIFSASFSVNCSYLKTWKYLILMQINRKFNSYYVIFKSNTLFSKFIYIYNFSLNLHKQPRYSFSRQTLDFDLQLIEYE